MFALFKGFLPSNRRNKSKGKRPVDEDKVQPYLPIFNPKEEFNSNYNEDYPSIIKYREGY